MKKFIKKSLSIILTFIGVTLLCAIDSMSITQMITLIPIAFILLAVGSKMWIKSTPKEFIDGEWI